jgi:hypothetical protein
MNYVKVESSQIAEVGFGEGHYGPETLGLKFPPNRKQLAAGELGSEYHYGNVTPRTHQALVAAPSIGIYFGKNIKNNPAYPYVKMEAENPTPPIPTMKSTIPTTMKSDGNGETTTENPTHPAPTKKNGTEPPSLFTAAGGADVEAKGATDILSPGSALALIDSMADDLLFTPGAITDAQLAAGRQWYLTEAKKYDISTEPKRTELKRFARPLQKLRTGIEARAKELTGATKRKIAAIDAEKRRLVQIVGGIEDDVLRPLTEWEAEEEVRKIGLAGTCKALEAMAEFYSYPDIASLEAGIAELEAFDVSTMQEYKVGAESAIAASLKVLKPELERRKVSEANEAELARLRAESAARAEADRLDAVAKQAREQAERESKAAVEYAEQKRLAAEQETKRQAELAEQRAIETAAQAKRDQEQAIENERMRVAVEAKREREAAEARAADKEHRTKVNYEAASALVSECQIDEPAAYAIIEAIAKGLITHVRIEY